MKKLFGTLMAVAALVVAFTSCNKEDVIKLKADQITLSVGDTYKIPVDKASGAITWASSNEAVATVNQDGLVSAIAEGSAAVTATVGKAKATVSVTVSAGGDDPSDAPDLEKPADGKLQVVIQIPAGSECHGIALKGTFDGSEWSGEDTYIGADGAATPVSGSIYRFAAIEGYENWYTVTIDATEALEFKVCLIYAGDGSWQGQATDVALHSCGFSSVEPEISGDGQCKNMGANGGLLYLHIGGWQKSECVVEEVVKRTVTVTVPECGFEVPSIVGSFNSWDATAIPMTLVSGFTFTAEVDAVASDEFKFAGSVSGWDNEIEAYDAENDTWNGLGNEKFGDQTTFNFDFSNPELYRWKACAASDTIPE